LLKNYGETSVGRLSAISAAAASQTVKNNEKPDCDYKISDHDCFTFSRQLLAAGHIIFKFNGTVEF